MDLRHVTERFAHYMQPVDRVIVKKSDLLPPGSEDQEIGEVIFDYQGYEEVQKLVDGFRPDSWSTMPCLCSGNSTIEFYSGDDFVFSLTEHHGNAFRGNFIPWVSDVRFSDLDSARKFLRWFSDHGFDGYEQLHALIEKNSSEPLGAVVKSISLLPAEAVALVSAAMSERFFIRASAGQVAEFRGLFESDEHMVHAIWRVYGKALELEEFDRFYELQKFLRPCLESVSFETYRAVLQELKLTEGDLLSIGAGWFFLESQSSEGLEIILGEPRWSELAKFMLKARNSPHLNIRRIKDVKFPAVADFLFAELMLLEPEKTSISRLWTPEGEPRSEREVSLFDDTESRFIDVLFELVDRKHPELQVYLEGALPDMPVGRDKLAVEVALALMDSRWSDLVGVNHLANGWDEIEVRAFRVLGRNKHLEFSVKNYLDALSRGGHRARDWAESRLDELALKSTNEEKEQRQFDELIAEAGSLLEHGEYSEAEDRLESTYSDQIDVDVIMARAKLGRGRVGEAVRAGTGATRLSQRRLDNPDKKLAEAFSIEGTVFWAMGNWNLAARSFRIGRRFHYSESERLLLMEHLAFSLNGTPELSDLNDWEPFGWSLVSVDDPEMVAEPLLGEATILFLRGTRPAAQLVAQIEREDAQPYRKDKSAILMARFALAVIARLDADYESEERLLNDVVGMKGYASTEHLLAKIRLKELEWAKRFGVPQTGFYLGR